MTDTPRLWDRRADETPKSYAAFLAYVALGARRSSVRPPVNTTSTPHQPGKSPATRILKKIKLSWPSLHYAKAKGALLLSPSPRVFRRHNCASWNSPQRPTPMEQLREYFHSCFLSHGRNRSVLCSKGFIWRSRILRRDRDCRHRRCDRPQYR